MMKKSLSHSRIKGVSYRRNVSGAPHAPSPKEKKFPEQLLASPEKNGEPQPLTRVDIHKLLQDLARQSLHTLMSEAVDMSSHWCHASRALDRTFEDSFFLDARKSISESDHKVNPAPQAETLLNARRNFRLWKHHIAILEMIAQAQHYVARSPQR